MCIYIILIYNYYIYIYIYELVNITYLYIQLWYIYIWYCMIAYYIIKCVCVIVLAQVCVRASCAQMEIELLPPVLLRRWCSMVGQWNSVQNGFTATPTVDIMYIYIYMCVCVMFIILYIVYIITIPLRLLFRGGPYQNVRYIFCNPPLNVKFVAERPPGVVLVGRVFKVPSKCKLTFSRPPSKTPWNMYLTFWVRAPLKTVVIMCIYIYIYRVYRCREREREKKE